MKKIILLTILSLIIFTLSFSLVLAKSPLEVIGSVGTAAGYSATTETSVATTVGKIINAFLAILGIVFLCYIIYAGYTWLIAGGSEEKIEKAKATIRASIIGLVIVLGAYAITAMVVSQFSKATGYNSTPNLTLPDVPSPS